MKKLFLVFFVFHFSLFTQAQGWAWGAQSTVMGDPESPNIAADNNGNAYFTGIFQDTVDFGAYHFSSGTGDNDFLVKYDSSGNILWAFQSTGTHNNLWGTNTVCTDDSNNVYVAGSFTGTLHFGTVSLTSGATAETTYLVKCNQAGTPVWGAVSWNSLAGNAQVIGLATDDSANVYLMGYYEDSVGFGSFTFANTSGSKQLFIVKYNQAGNAVWAEVSKGGMGNSSYTEPTAVTCSLQNLVCITGYFHDTLFMGNDTLVCPSSATLFLLQFDRNGNLILGRQGTNVSPNALAIPSGIATDGFGSTYVTGLFEDTISIGGLSLLSSCSLYPYDAFLVKFNSAGKGIWLKKSNCNWAGWSLCSDTNNVIYISGGAYPGGTISFCDTILTVSSPTDAAFFLKLDTAGKAFAGNIIRTGGDDYNCIVSSPNGKCVYVGGDIYDTITFNKNFLNNKHEEMPFIARWGNPYNEETTVQSLKNKMQSVTVFPNPSTGIFTIQLPVVSRQLSVEVYNVLGEKVYSTPNLLPPSGGSATFSCTINISSQPNGLYLYRVLNADGGLIGEGKIIIQK